MPCECHVVDGKPASLPVDYPLARHDPEPAEVWPRRGNAPGRLSAHRIAVIPAPGEGRVVIGDKGPGVREWHRVHSDQGSGGRSQHRVARPRPAPPPSRTHCSPISRRYLWASNPATPQHSHRRPTGGQPRAHQKAR